MDEKIAAACLQAETLLSGVYQAPIRLEMLDQFESGHTVLRCAVRVKESAPSLGKAVEAKPPRTVIVKQRNFDQPNAPAGFDQAVLFRNEWASLDFLTSLSGGGGLGPRLIASDRQAGLVVLEDLGSAQSVQDVLFSNDRQAAVDALVGMGGTLGRLQRLTAGREAEFVALQAAMETATTVCDATLDLRGSLAELSACLAGLGINPHPGFENAINSLENGIHGQGVFRAFLHNDAGPHNFVVAATGVQPLDFEFAGYGNGLVDAACALLAFPPSFRGRVLPVDVARQVEDAYRAELGLGTAGFDDEAFNEAVAQASAYWAFSKLDGFWNGYLRERLVEGAARDTRGGRPPERSAFSRRQNFSYLRLALGRLEELDQLPVLRLVLTGIVERLLGLWPETELLPTYPAFGGEPWHYP